MIVFLSELSNNTFEAINHLSNSAYLAKKNSHGKQKVFNFAFCVNESDGCGGERERFGGWFGFFNRRVLQKFHK